jgi:hypothetical protein
VHPGGTTDVVRFEVRVDGEPVVGSDRLGKVAEPVVVTGRRGSAGHGVR